MAEVAPPSKPPHRISATATTDTCPRAISTYLALCRFTDLDMGRELSDGTVDLAHEDELVWLVTIPDVEFPIHPPPDKAHLYPHHYLADMVVVVDASTGRFIMAMSVNPR